MFCCFVASCRSRSSGCSSVESNWFGPSTAEEQHQWQASNDVFDEPEDSTDCQARFCPIHQYQGGFTAAWREGWSSRITHAAVRVKLVVCHSHEIEREEVSSRNFRIQLYQ